ncbi:MAG: hypothetical protein MJY49_05905 [Bacteroidales bacterium]|nr:hypothetical protein [Bacteroidales bacterium]
MKRAIYMAIAVLASLMAASCSKPFELNVDFSLNRTDLRFKSDESQSYFMVYSKSDWTVAFDEDVSWARLGKTSGNGVGQVNVYCSSNPGVSRGVNLTVTNSDGKQKTIYLSQNGGTTKPEYTPEDGTLDLFNSALNPVVAIKTNLDEASVKTATISVSCPDYGEPWIKNVTASVESVYMEVDAFEGTGGRVGTVLISFPCARWEENPCRCAITVKQTDETPGISLLPVYNLDPAGDQYTDIEVETNWNPKYYTYSIGYEFPDSPTWIADHLYDGKKTISVKPLSNYDEGAVARETSFKCVVKDADGNVMKTGGVEISATATLAQAVGSKPLVPVCLTTGGKYANSFLIESTDTTLYCVDLKRIDGTVVENAISSRVLWQTTENLVGSTYVRDAQLFFTQSKGKTGNALIGVLDATGKIVWSYHVWITDVPVAEHKFGSYVFMDRNLGATCATAPTGTETPAAGMHYEWGRKDPFPPVDGYTPTGNRDHMTIFPDPITFVTAQDGKPVSYTVENPTAYLWGSAGSGKEDWIDVQDADLWGGKTGGKTNYDPCPYGWEVPSEAQMGDILTKIQASSGVKNYGITITDKDGKASFFPCPGYYRRTTNASSQMCNVGTFGWLWTRTTGAYNNAYIGGRRLQVHNTVGNRTFATQPNRWGANIRCVKQN